MNGRNISGWVLVLLGMGISKYEANKMLYNKNTKANMFEENKNIFVEKSGVRNFQPTVDIKA